MLNKQAQPAYWQHLLAFVVFLALSLIYFKPLMGDEMLKQDDILQFELKNKETFDFREKYGSEPLWTNRMFSGMPTFMMSMKTPGNLIRSLRMPSILWLPLAAGVLFLTMFSFYVLLQVLKVEPFLAIASAVGFGFCSYYFQIIVAGHNTKAHAMAIAPLVLAGYFLLFQRKYLVGLAFTSFAVALQFAVNHIQISYYTFMLLGLLMVIHLVVSIKQKEIAHFGKVVGLFAIALVLAAGCNLGRFMIVQEYVPDTMRGGQSELTGNKATGVGGLDKEYAYRWSYGPGETLNLLIPNARGGSSGDFFVSDRDSETYKALVSLRNKNADQLAQLSKHYWGDQMFTSGPFYMGAIVLFLCIVGFVLLPWSNPLKIWLLIATFFAITMAWGRHFPYVIDIFFNYVPQFNKFRVPSMILTVAQLSIGLSAALALKEIVSRKAEKQDLLKLYVTTGVVAGVCLITALFAGSLFDFSSETEAMQNLPAIFQDALAKDRAALLQADAWRTLAFVLAGAALIWLVFTRKIKDARLFGAALLILILADQWPVANRYLNDKHYQDAKAHKKEFRPKPVDLEILKDNSPSYRVFNLTAGITSDSRTSYFHQSIGGYHPAKFYRYQELVDYHLQKEQRRIITALQKNPDRQALNAAMEGLNVTNMLNAKYFIYNPEAAPLVNRFSNGNAWFVKNLKVVDDANQEINSLGGTNLKETVVIDKRFESYLEGLPKADLKQGTVTMTSYLANHLKYESNASEDGFAVFSEIYYNHEKGWKAYIDGEEAEHIRVNYVLRGLKIPAGKHQIEFRFEPKSYYTGEKIALASSSVIMLLIIGAIGMAAKQKFKKA